MTDELDRLKSALKQAAPEAGAEARARALRAGMESFDRVHQGTEREPRLSAKAPRGATSLQQGLMMMWTQMTSRPFLLATTSLGTIAVALVVVQQVGLSPVMPRVTETTVVTDAVTETAPVGPVAPEQPATTLGERDDAQVLKSVDAESALIAPAAPSSAPEPMAPVAGQVVGRVRNETAPMTALGDDASGAPERRELDLTAAMPAPVVVMEQSADADMAAIAFDQPSGDVFAGEAANPLKITAQEPVSTFSIDVDTASYSYVRAALLDGYSPQADAVRVEELINYFDYAYPAPDSAEVPFRPSVSVADTPWNPGTRLVHIAIQGYTPDAGQRAPANLVFLIDTSGSMEDANKLPLLVQSFRLMLSNLQPDDRVAIVTYAGSAGLVLEPTPVSESRKILASLQNLAAGGSTAGAEGLQQAYAVAEDMAGDSANARVILATDGDFNVGISDPEELKSFIAAKRDSGIYLSVLGFGRGNYDDATMQALAQNGNGQAAYIDTLAEAQKVLVEDVAATLVPIANDVKIQVEWNPATVAEYRLIGYESRILNREDFNNDRIDAGEIGSGHTLTALYEITPVGSAAVMTDDLRYGDTTVAPATAFTGELGFLKLRYKLPGATASRLIETPITPDRVEIAATETRFAAAVAGFGELLRGNQALGDWSWHDVITLAEGARGEDRFGYRAEFIRLAGLAKSAQ